MAISIIQERMVEDKQIKFVQNYEKLQDVKIVKMRKELKAKMLQLDEFKKTIENSEWKELQEKEKKQEMIEAHEEFIQKLQEEKVFKQLLYAAEKKLEQEERKKQRENALKNKHNVLLNEQQKLEEELYMLQQMYD